MNTPDSLLELLRTHTRPVHEQLDRRITASQPFASRRHFSRFLQAQFLFLHDAEPLYTRADLTKHLTDLGERSRCEPIAADLQDLGIASPAQAGTPASQTLSEAEAWGWLYVVEGSKLGAALLLKQAATLGLSETFGARHMAAHADGRAPNWRVLTTALNALSLTALQRESLVKGANDAFLCMNAHLDRILTEPVETPA